MDLITKLKGLWHIGWRPIAASVGYGLRRTQMERREKPRWPELAPARPPGTVQRARLGDGLASFELEGARLEIRALRPDLLRVTWRPGLLPLPYALAEREWDPVAVTLEESPEGWTVETDELSVAVGSDGSLRFSIAGGPLLRTDLPPLRLSSAWTHRAQSRPDERYFGLGERTSALNLRGGRFRMWNREPKGHYGPGDDPIYLCIPVYLGGHDEGSYLVFFESSFDATFSFGDEELSAELSGGALRYYFAPGPPARALARYTELTGRAPLPPRWALGFHQSRWGYRSEREIREVVRGFVERSLPLSAIHLDIHYMDGYRVFTVDRRRFPDLPGLTAELADEGVRTVMIVDPGVKQDPAYEVYREGLERDVFCKLPGGDPVVAPVWPGPCCFPDFTQPEARLWWGERYRFLVEVGAAGVWHDMNEPSAFTAWGDASLPTATRHDLEGRGGRHAEAHNLYALLEGRAGFEALKRHRPDVRPWLLTRSGWAGIQRYAWTWTGDSESNWWGVAQSLRIALAMGLCGVPYSGPDIGGFGGEPDDELLVRWFQLASFLPFFRMHSAVFVSRREPWTRGPEVLAVLRRYLDLRYRLLPYWYALAREASSTGCPLVRPLFWETETASPQWDVEDAFLLGPSLLVAPIVAEGERRRSVPLPGGHWYSFWDDTVLEGPAEHSVEAPLERLPLFVRAGSVIPMDDAEGPTLHVYALPRAPDGPGAAPGQGAWQPGGALYTDAGDGYDAWRLDRFRQRREGGRIVISRQVEGDFEWGAADRLGVVVHGASVKGVVRDGRPLEATGRRFVVGEFEELVVEVEPT